MKPADPEKRYQELASKWLSNKISTEEMAEFSAWYNSGQEGDVQLTEEFAKDDEELKNRIFANINLNVPEPSRTGRSLRSWYATAAAILIVLSSGIYFYLNESPTNGQALEPVSARNADRSLAVAPPERINSAAQVPKVTDVAPGQSKAVLTLGDGKKIILDDAVNGILASEGGHSILKTAKGELIYSFSSSEPDIPAGNMSVPVSFNMIETPKGGKFQVKLPDGSRVWLNAASTLRFPTAFSGSKREVELTGEAYFEVAHDPSRLFEVTTSKQIVQVLGTHFNINAYADEPSVNTTLLEGSVRISDLRTSKVQLLKPGEQAQLGEKLEIVNIKNISEPVAWKEGYFQFEDADIQTVMRQIERWYDVKVRYEGGQIPVNRFGGEIERSLTLMQLLKILEKTKVDFRLEGKEVIVMR